MKQVLDKIPKPPGALPARAQTWLLGGLAAVIALTLVTFPGQPDRAAAAAGNPADGDSGALPLGSVESAAQRMKDEAALAAERRLRRDLGVPEPRPDGLPHPPRPVDSGTAAGTSRSGGFAGSQAPGAAEQIEREESVRRYRSLRAPSLVQSRRDRGPASPERQPQPEEDDSRAVLELLGKLLESAPELGAEAADRPDAGARGTDSRLHTLHAGDYLEAVLANRLDGEFPGPVVAMVSADVYDRTRQHLLVPSGTRAIGSASQVQSWEQTRLAVTFRSLIFPDGRAVALGDSTGLNQIGESGLKDRVNRRYPSVLAAAGAVGALAGLSQAVSPQDAFASRLGAARVSTGAGLSRAAERILDRYLNRLPKVTIREGHRLRIYLAEDLRLPAYPGVSRRPGQAAATNLQGETP